jgi:hypothetical protein
VFAEGNRLRLVASGYDSGVSPWDEPSVSMGILYGEATRLELPVVVDPMIYEAPAEVTG